MRLTVSLSDDLYLAVKLEAAATGKTIGEILESGLRAIGLKSPDDIDAILARASHKANLSKQEALELGLQATREVRENMASSRK